MDFITKESPFPSPSSRFQVFKSDVEKTPIFSKIRDVTGTMSLSLTFRFRGASFRICGAPYRPKSKQASLSLYAFAVRRIPVTIETVVSISRFGSVNAGCRTGLHSL